MTLNSQAVEHNGRRPLEPASQEGRCLLHTPRPYTSERWGHEAPACLQGASLSTGDTWSPTNKPVSLIAQHEHQTPPKQGTLTDTPLTGWSHCLENTCSSGAPPETSTPMVGQACQEKAIANTQLPLQAEQFLNLHGGVIPVCCLKQQPAGAQAPEPCLQGGPDAPGDKGLHTDPGNRAAGLASLPGGHETAKADTQTWPQGQRRAPAKQRLPLSC